MSKKGKAGDGTKAGLVLRPHWPATPAAWETGLGAGGPIPDFQLCHATPTVVGRFHAQAVLQRRVLA